MPGEKMYKFGIKKKIQLQIQVIKSHKNQAVRLKKIQGVKYLGQAIQSKHPRYSERANGSWREGKGNLRLKKKQIFMLYFFKHYKYTHFSKALQAFSGSADSDFIPYRRFSKFHKCVGYMRTVYNFT